MALVTKEEGYLVLCQIPGYWPKAYSCSWLGLSIPRTPDLLCVVLKVVMKRHGTWLSKSPY